MNRTQFREWLNESVVVLDGATGTEMSRRGMPAGVCPEQWALEHPEALREVQRAYADAGSRIVYTFTFGASPFKLQEFGLDSQTYEINRKLAELSREAVGGRALVAGDIAPTGRLVAPMGDTPFEDIVFAYRRQVAGLLAGGVDLFAIETMMDIQEARAALIAVREQSNLPVIVTMTYEAGGRTLMGTDPKTALATLQSLGADAVGCNCSFGPSEMIELLRMMKPYAHVPLVAKPNAGKPRLEDGRTVFDMSDSVFSEFVPALVEAGANAIGGCCGTSPAYIRRVSAWSKSLTPQAVPTKFDVPALVSSARQAVELGLGRPLAVIGERLNPTGKKQLKQALLEDDMDEVFDIARAQMDEGANLLDVNAGVPGADEKALLVRMVETALSATPLPLVLDSSNPAALEAALRIYPGRAIINSVSGEREKLANILPLAARYGAMFILLPLDDSGVPATADARRTVALRVLEEAARHGLGIPDILLDGLVMTIGADPEAAAQTLRFVEWAAHELRANTTMGLSNISFGLPGREWVNAAFMAMAINRGLSTAILNPGADTLNTIRMASDMLMAHDSEDASFIRRMTGQKNEAADAGVDPIRKAILDGSAQQAENAVRAKLAAGATPSAIVDGDLIPAITEVGARYERKTFFLPQLIRGAEAMQHVMRFLEPMIREQNGGAQASRGRVVIATVAGDIHDIGKNIVALLLKNNGFEVVDLGKDVPTDRIVAAVRKHAPDILCLSALMTTTMIHMPDIAAALRRAELHPKLMVGGAVLDESYAAGFGAVYTADAHAAVQKALELMQ